MFILRGTFVELPVQFCMDEPKVPEKLTDKKFDPRDTDALQYLEDVRLAGADCRDGVNKNREFQDKHNDSVEDFNAKAEAEAKKIQ